MRKITFLLIVLATSMHVLAIEGALSGKFTTNAQGDQVSFSQGNLQYQASTDTWRFATNQYDFIGDDTNGNVYENNAKCNNELISDTYDGWIDLFGWGTGKNPTRSSQTSLDFRIFDDWGVNVISNGGDTDSLWRTLTKDEWGYLLYGRTNAAVLFGLGSVSGVHGAILLPDNWTLPAGVSFTASTTRGLEYRDGYYINDNSDNFSHNTYTAAQWAVMESAGAVFLPTACYRSGTNWVDWLVGSEGHYWSTTPDGAFRANCMYFHTGYIGLTFSDYTYYGQSVRLVSEIEPTTQTAVEDVQVNGTQVVKRIANGQILIEKNGKFYNATGVEIR